MGGRNGLTLAEYGAMSDRQIVAVLTVKWDDDGRLIGETDEHLGDVEERIEASQSAMPPAETLGLADAELGWAQSLRPAVGTMYVLMFWQVHKNRQRAGLPMYPGGDHPITDEEIKKKWVEHLSSDH